MFFISQNCDFENNLSLNKLFWFCTLLRDMVDPRIITTLGVLLGFDITTPSAFTGEDESEEMETDSPPPQTSADSKSASSPNPNSPDSSAPSSSEKVNSKVMSLDRAILTKENHWCPCTSPLSCWEILVLYGIVTVVFFLSCQALEEKEKGNAAYKKKDFEVALGHYSAAIELDPTNITFRNNRAGGKSRYFDWSSSL